MAGELCSDNNGIQVIGPNGRKACVIDEGNEDLAGLLTLSNGLVLKVEKDSPDTYTSTDKTPVPVEADLDKTDKFSGTEIGPCKDTVLVLSKKYEGHQVKWTTKDLRSIHKLFGQKEGEFGNAFFCSDSGKSGAIGINNSPGQKDILIKAIESLEEDHSAFDDLHYHALLQGLCNAAGVPVPKSTGEKVVDALIEIGKVVAGLFGAWVVFGPGLSWWNNRGGGTGGHGGSGGVSKSGKFSPTMGALANANAGQEVPVSTETDAAIAPPKNARSATTVSGGTFVPNRIGAPAPVFVPKTVVVP